MLCGTVVASQTNIRTYVFDQLLPQTLEYTNTLQHKQNPAKSYVCTWLNVPFGKEIYSQKVKIYVCTFTKIDIFHTVKTYQMYTLCCSYVCMYVVDKSLLWLVQLAFCSEYIPHVPAKGGIYLLCILETQNQLLFVEKCIKLIRFCRSVSTSSVLSWYMGNVHRSVPLILPSTRIHVHMYTVTLTRPKGSNTAFNMISLILG